MHESSGIVFAFSNIFIFVVNAHANLLDNHLFPLHKWNQFDHHHPTRVDNGFEHGVIYSKILVFKQVTCHSLLRAQSNLTKQVHVSRRHCREWKLFCERSRGGGIRPIPFLQDARVRGQRCYIHVRLMSSLLG